MLYKYFFYINSSSCFINIQSVIIQNKNCQEEIRSQIIDTLIKKEGLLLLLEREDKKLINQTYIYSWSFNDYRL